MDNIKLLTIVTDCDGILTTPFFTYNVDGKAEKHFYVNDSITMKQLRDHHSDIIKQIIILTGDEGPGFNVTDKRVDDLMLGDFVKLERCPNIKKHRWLIDRYERSNGEFNYIYFGDDLPDAAIARNVCSSGCFGFGTTDAAPACLQHFVRHKKNVAVSRFHVAPQIGAFTNLVECFLSSMFDRSLLDAYERTPL